MIPKAFKPLAKVLAAIKAEPAIFDDLEIHFIGSGTSPNNPEGYNIKPLAVKYGVWQKNVFEYAARIPYLDVLIHLNAASGVFILGSTEPHYTPSKVYQGVLSKKPVWAILHKESSACKVIQLSGAGIVLEFDGENDLETITKKFSKSYGEFKDEIKNYDYEKINQLQFEKYSAQNVTGILAAKLNSITEATN